VLGIAHVAKLYRMRQEAVMSPLISMHLARAIAVSSRVHRSGARHAMMIFVRRKTSEIGDAEAIAAAEERGWIDVELGRSKVLDPDLDLIEDDILRGAAEHASIKGSSVVVYADELPLDS
jgi:hypothetical protein